MDKGLTHAMGEINKSFKEASDRAWSRPSSPDSAKDREQKVKELIESYEIKLLDMTDEEIDSEYFDRII